MPSILLSHSERGDFASWAFAVIDEQGFDRKNDIKSAKGGYEISDRLWAALHPEYIPFDKQDEIRAGAIEEIAATLDPADVDPRGDEEKAYAILTPDVIEDAPASANVDRETIRIWAKENGLKAADKGALSKAVLEAYDAAHQS